MIFAAPPDSAAKALLEHGTSSQRVDARRRKPPAVKLSSPRPHVARTPSPGSFREVHRQPRTAASLVSPPDTEAEELKAEADMINYRVNQLIEHFVNPDGKLKIAADGTVQGEPTFEELTKNIHRLLGQQADKSTTRTMALENVVSAIQTHGEDAQDGEDSQNRSAELQRLAAADANSDGAQLDALVERTVADQKTKTRRLVEVHAKHAQMVKLLIVKVVELEGAIEEKRKELEDAGESALKLQVMLGENESLRSIMQSDLDKLYAENKKLGQDLKKELDKPPPPPPPCSQAELDTLQADFGKARADLAKAREDIVRTRADVSEAKAQAEVIARELDAARLQCKSIEQRLSESEASVASLTEQGEELQRQVRATEQELTDAKNEAVMKLDKLYRENEAREQDLKTRLQEAKEEAEATRTSAKEEMAKARAAFEQEKQVIKRKAGEEAAKLREQVAHSEQLVTKAEAMAKGAAELKEQLEHARHQASEAEAQAREAQSRAQFAESQAQNAEALTRAAQAEAKEAKEAAEVAGSQALAAQQEVSEARAQAAEAQAQAAEVEAKAQLAAEEHKQSLQAFREQAQAEREQLEAAVNARDEMPRPGSRDGIDGFKRVPLKAENTVNEETASRLRALEEEIALLRAQNESLSSQLAELVATLAMPQEEQAKVAKEVREKVKSTQQEFAGYKAKSDAAKVCALLLTCSHVVSGHTITF